MRLVLGNEKPPFSVIPESSSKSIERPGANCLKFSSISFISNFKGHEKYSCLPDEDELDMPLIFYKYRVPLRTSTKSKGKTSHLSAKTSLLFNFVFYS